MIPRSTTLWIGNICMAILFSLSSCQKADFEELKPADKQQEHSNYAKKGDQNPDDSLDHLGAYHNRAFDHLAAEKCIDSTESIRYEKVKTFMADNLSGDHFLNFKKTENAYEDFLGDTAGNRSGLIALSTDYFPDYLKSHSTLSSSVENYFENMETHYENFDGVASLKNDLENLESDVEADSALSSSQAELLQGALAVAKKDLEYWDEVRSDNDHDWHEHFTENLTSSEEEALMLNLSLSSGVGFALIYDRAQDNGYTSDDRLSVASVQAAFNPGPIIVDTGSF